VLYIVAAVRLSFYGFGAVSAPAWINSKLIILSVDSIVGFSDFNVSSPEEERQTQKSRYDRLITISMTSALLLINCIIGLQDNVIDELRKLSEFVDVYRVQDTYDIIAKINAGSEEELQEITMSNIRKIKGIKSTLTLVIVKHSQA
jgi:DNA-binding Lrp family transcriptional regulator